ncbi:putative phage terminase [Corynebacterium kutscheri]|nr:putative phage terminase [Corynebacterium kutscheri]
MWRFTDGQARFLILWYAYDEHGRFIYRRGVKRGAKGLGKDWITAAMCCMELLAPSQLWWDGEKWTGKRHELPLVQIASNSETQSKKLLRVANAMLGADAVEYYRLDKGQTATFVKGTGARMEVLTASERSAEGDPATFSVLNETHHFTEASGGHRLAAVARRNVGKSKRALQARMVEFTNAHTQGANSVGEQSFEAWQKQQSGKYKGLNKDILYDSIEADPRLDFYDVLLGRLIQMRHGWILSVLALKSLTRLYRLLRRFVFILTGSLIRKMRMCQRKRLLLLLIR